MGEEDVIRDHILNFYKELFAETEKWRSKWSDEELIKISEEEKIWLEEPFTSEEVEAVVKMFEGDKAPGPDGFNMYFFQKCWNTVKEDVMKTVETFWQEGTFVSSLNATFITLIPKKKGAEETKDFIFITLLGSVYKIIAKLLAGRLKKVIRKLISENQNAFLKGRQISDAALVANDASTIILEKERLEWYVN